MPRGKCFALKNLIASLRWMYISLLRDSLYIIIQITGWQEVCLSTVCTLRIGLFAAK